MNPLEQKIIRRISTEGPLTFETFMDMALYDPDHGYYAARGQRIGREGDFYTSSHLHPVFGAMIGKQILEMWETMGRPEHFTVLEMGAGEGFVCKDMLGYLQRVGSGVEETGEAINFIDTVRYVIVERNALQRQRQQELLKDYHDMVTWVPGLREAGKITGCAFSNELLDAFPVHIVTMAEELKEVYVGYEDGVFRSRIGPLSTQAISRYFDEAGITLDSEYTSEVNLRLKDWLSDIADVLEQGFVFTIDYGYSDAEYYSEERNRGTLMCYFRHQLGENPYDHIGEQDITAHVNFSSLRRWGEEKGIRAVGYCSQGTFLLAMGIDEEIARLAGISADYLFELGRIKKLFMPQGFGESHRVMIQQKGCNVSRLRGFSIRNQLRLL